MTAKMVRGKRKALPRYRDLQLVSLAHFVDKIQQESARQLTKWGVQNRTAFEWMCYLTEEIGEIAQAINEHQYRGGPAEHVVVEAVQAATLLLKIAEIFDEQASIDPCYICGVCATARGAVWPKGHRATMHTSVCHYCRKRRSLASVGDYDWPRGSDRPPHSAGRD